MPCHELPHQHSEEAHLPEFQQELLKVSEFRAISEVFRQVGDPTRIRIFWLLCHCEECVINIAALMDMSSPAVSHHLRTLRDTGLILGTRKGKEVFYRAADTRIARLLHEMIEQVMRIQCPEERHGSEPE